MRSSEYSKRRFQQLSYADRGQRATGDGQLDGVGGPSVVGVVNRCSSIAMGIHALENGPAGVDVGAIDLVEVKSFVGLVQDDLPRVAVIGDGSNQGRVSQEVGAAGLLRTTVMEVYPASERVCRPCKGPFQAQRREGLTQRQMAGQRELGTEGFSGADVGSIFSPDTSRDVASILAEEAAIAYRDVVSISVDLIPSLASVCGDFDAVAGEVASVRPRADEDSS